MAKATYVLMALNVLAWGVLAATGWWYTPQVAYYTLIPTAILACTVVMPLTLRHTKWAYPGDFILLFMLVLLFPYLYLFNGGI